MGTVDWTAIPQSTPTESVPKFEKLSFLFLSRAALIFSSTENPIKSFLVMTPMTWLSLSTTTKCLNPIAVKSMYVRLRQKLVGTDEAETFM